MQSAFPSQYASIFEHTGAVHQMQDERAAYDLTKNPRLRDLDMSVKQRPRPPAADDDVWRQRAHEANAAERAYTGRIGYTLPVVAAGCDGTDAGYLDANKFGERQDDRNSVGRPRHQLQQLQQPQPHSRVATRLTGQPAHQPVAQTLVPPNSSADLTTDPADTELDAAMEPARGGNAAIPAIDRKPMSIFARVSNHVKGTLYDLRHIDQLPVAGGLFSKVKHACTRDERAWTWAALLMILFIVVVAIIAIALACQRARGSARHGDFLDAMPLIDFHD